MRRTGSPRRSGRRAEQFPVDCRTQPPQFRRGRPDKDGRTAEAGRAAFWITATGDFLPSPPGGGGRLPFFRFREYAAGGSYGLSPVWTAVAACGQSCGTNDANNDLGSFGRDAVMSLLQLARSVQVNTEDSLFLSMQEGYGAARRKGPLFPRTRPETAWKASGRIRCGYSTYRGNGQQG